VVGVTNPLGPRLRAGPSSAFKDRRARRSRWPNGEDRELDRRPTTSVVTGGPVRPSSSKVVAADRRELLELTNRMRALEGVVSTEDLPLPPDGSSSCMTGVPE